MRIPMSGVLALVTAGSLAACGQQDRAQANPSFPRIGTVYGTGVAWQAWEKGAEWWSKLDLIIGGCYDLHYDWENPRWPKVLANVEANLTKLREVNPNCLVLPYVDVVEGPDNPNVPQAWWDLRDGQRWSGWPGYFRINTKLPEVLQFNLDKVRDEVMARPMFDGVFYDCWGPDDWLVPRTARLRDGKAIVMINDWNLPSRGFETLNGCLAEDELNRVADGKVDFEEFLGRYLRWCRESRKPAVTMLVCHPRTVNEDCWGNATRTPQERDALKEKARTADPQMLRFGLTTTLLGDGYFGYDGGNGLSRGNWWWYPEYDAPLGYPKGPAERRDDGLWQRAFDGGLVVVNGTGYDAVLDTPVRSKDASIGRVGTRFTIPLCDGRILLPTDDPDTPGDDTPPRFTRAAPASLGFYRVDASLLVARTPGDLELRCSPAGELRQILLRGRTIMSGGWPSIANPPWKVFQIESSVEPCVAATAQEVRLTFRGVLAEGGGRIEYVETLTLTPDNRFSLHFDFTALTDLDLRAWRHYFAFPVWLYAGAVAECDGQQITLPADAGNDQLLPESSRVTVTGKDAKIQIDSSSPLKFSDHRKWNTPEYLLAAYPLEGQMKTGVKLSVELTVQVTSLPAP